MAMAGTNSSERKAFHGSDQIWPEGVRVACILRLNSCHGSSTIDCTHVQLQFPFIATSHTITIFISKHETLIALTVRESTNSI